MKKEFSGVVPILTYEDGAAALVWLAKAFGFREQMRMHGPDGKIMHAEMDTGHGAIMLATGTPDYQGRKRHRETCAAARAWSTVPRVIEAYWSSWTIWILTIDRRVVQAQLSSPNRKMARRHGDTAWRILTVIVGCSCSAKRIPPNNSLRPNPLRGWA